MTRHTPISVFMLALLSTTSLGQTLRGAWVVCTRDLKLRESLIDHADERELVLLSEYGIRSRVAMSDVLFMVQSETQDAPVAEIVGAPLPERSPVRLVTLIDAQVVRGTIIEPELPEQLAFTLIAGRSTRGQARIPIGRVRRIADVQAPPVSNDAASLRDDTLITRTGDEIVGFIESIGPMTRVSLRDGSELEIETSRLSEVHFANERENTPGIYLTMNDHETLRAGVFEYDNQQPITIDVDTTALGLDDTGNSTWIFDTNSLRSLQVIDPALRVVGLGEIEPDRVEANGDRDWVPVPVLLDRASAHPTLSSIDFPSPMRVSYTLPRGATRFACNIETPVQQWTDCVVRVIAQSNSGANTLLEQRFNSTSTTAELNMRLPIGATALIIEIDPGEHGPIQDRVLLHQPRLLIER